MSESSAAGPERGDRAEGEVFSQSALRKDAAGEVASVLLLGAVFGAFPVAWRNRQLGRTDLSGAVRVGVLFLALTMTGWLLAATHSWSFVAEKSLFINQLGTAAFGFLLLVVLYLALEPFMRQRWPERLSSWNRLLTGQFRDPLVGRDVLLGIVIGTVLAMTPKVTAWALGTHVLFAPIYEPFTPAAPPGVMFYLAGDAVVRAVGGFGLLILLLLLLRREWLALVVLVVLVALKSQQTFVTFPPGHWLTWVGCGVLGILVVFTIARFGLVTLLLAQFTAVVIHSMPVTTNPEPWYTGVTVVSVAVLLALATFGCFVALGGLRAIPEQL